MSTKIRVLIVDDHPFFRQGVRLFLESLEDVEVVGEALETMAYLFSQRQNVPVDLEINLNEQITPQIEFELYRIAQEAFANVEKHASAKRVILSINYKEPFVQWSFRSLFYFSSPANLMSTDEFHCITAKINTEEKGV